MNTIICAWCKDEFTTTAEVAPDSHGICAPCARAWDRPYLPQPRANLAGDIAAFQRWAWSHEGGR